MLRKKGSGKAFSCESVVLSSVRSDVFDCTNAKLCLHLGT